ncbi:ORF MSV070 hypothetical protein [Melanoplus sanguinipes entomopoxvirus]|uniref:Uncharacterized protein n=1 Tax=Melanoplus sanguinipes entomopoxvirus TaxID=83191 RepID=Q9YW22_MSEPV|nr:ORF MSV070 hypothetical protein [Melanoplus sanguinipes entomopoxvirus]AAC97626.1 ORF MSV070 hypothetical protein [Melanoplus sanguinipes entomopoxvirus 'O']
MIKIIKIYLLPLLHKSLHYKLTKLVSKRIIYKLRNKCEIDDIENLDCLFYTHVIKINNSYYYVYNNYHLISFTVDTNNKQDLYNKLKTFDFCYHNNLNEEMMKAYCQVNNIL